MIIDKIKEIRQFSQKYGFELISETYSSREPLTFKCPNGHVIKMLWHNFKRNKSCGKCVGNQRLSYKEVEERFNKAGFELLEKTYVNANTPIAVKCSKGHESKKTLSSLNCNIGCIHCSSNALVDLSLVAKLFSDNDFTVNCNLEKTYENNRTKIPLICPQGHKVEISYKHFRRGSRCRVCNGGGRLTQEDVELMLSSEGIELLSEYVNYNTKFKYKCTCGSIAYGYISPLLKGIRCGCGYKSGEDNPRWNPNLTKEEREVSRKYPEYHKWVQDVYERDDYTCQCCGGRGEELNAHHIKSYKDHKDLRTDVNNGITLCEDCHKKFHIKYGYVGFSASDLEDFLVDCEDDEEDE